MTFTQKFYPEFIKSAFMSNGEDSFFYDQTTRIAVSLLQTNSGMTFDADRFQGYTANQILSFSSYVEGLTLKGGTYLTTTLSRSGSKLVFNIPNVLFNHNGSSFQDGIIFIERDNSWYPFIHINFGSLQTPSAGFTLIQNTNCMPCIDFTPIACSL